MRSRAKTNQEGERIGDCSFEGSARKRKRLQGWAGQDLTDVQYMKIWNLAEDLQMFLATCACVCVCLEGWAPCSQEPGRCRERVEEKREGAGCKESAAGGDAEIGSHGAGSLQRAQSVSGGESGEGRVWEAAKVRKSVRNRFSNNLNTLH